MAEWDLGLTTLNASNATSGFATEDPVRNLLVCRRPGHDSMINMCPQGKEQPGNQKISKPHQKNDSMI